MIQILSKEYEFEITGTYTFGNQFSQPYHNTTVNKQVVYLRNKPKFVILLFWWQTTIQPSQKLRTY